MGLTKQALLHHFGSKEKLYGEVLKDISERLLEATQQITEAEEDPATRLVDLVVVQYRGQMEQQDSARLLMRELLDNEQRAANAANWYLKPYLEILIDTVLAIKATHNIGRARALALVYQLLGAAHYFAVSQPTLTSIFGASLYRDSRDCYEEELRSLIGTRVQA